MTTYTNYVSNRTQKTAQAFQAINEARRILAELEKVTVFTAEGKTLDLGETVHLTYGLRNAVDHILVGLVEAATVPLPTHPDESKEQA